MSDVMQISVTDNLRYQIEYAALSETIPAAGSAIKPSIEALIVRDVVGLEPEWIALRFKSPGYSFYQSYEWCSAWINACNSAGCPEDLRIVTVREHGRLVLLWPLAARRRGPVTILHALAEPATQYCDLLIEHSPSASAWLESAWNAVMSQTDVDLIRLRKVRADGPIHRHLGSRLGAHLISTGAAPFLRLVSSGARPPLRSGRSLNALRRHLKRLNEMGTVRFEVVAKTGHAAALNEAFRLKQAWSLDRGMMSAGYSHVANVDAITSLARDGAFAIHRLRVGETTAAVEIGALENGHYYSMIQSYDSRYAQHAPGRLLWWKMFEDSSTGISTFDFMPPLQPHKTEWTQECVPVADYAVVRSYRGRIYLALSRELKPRLKALHRKIPPPIKSALADLGRRGRRAMSFLSLSRVPALSLSDGNCTIHPSPEQLDGRTDPSRKSKKGDRDRPRCLTEAARYVSTAGDYDHIDQVGRIDVSRHEHAN